MKVKMSKKRQLLLGGVIIAIAAIGITYAFLSAKSNKNINEFSGAYGQVNISVVENDKPNDDHEDNTNNMVTFDKLEKGQSAGKIVQIKNLDKEEYHTADTYVRVKLVPMIVKDGSTEKDFNTYGGSVKLEYTMNTDNTNWKYDKSTDTYYYGKVLVPGETSDVLLKSVKVLSELPDGYHLEIQVLSDGILANDVDNLQSAWGLQKNDQGDYFTNLSKVTSPVKN